MGLPQSLVLLVESVDSVNHLLHQLNLLVNVELLKCRVTWGQIMMVARLEVTALMIPVDVPHLLFNVEMIRWSVTVGMMLITAGWDRSVCPRMTVDVLNLQCNVDLIKCHVTWGCGMVARLEITV